MQMNPSPKAEAKKATITVGNAFYRFPEPYLPRNYLDRYGRSIIYNEWNAKPKEVIEDERIRRWTDPLYPIFIGLSILLIIAIIAH